MSVPKGTIWQDLRALALDAIPTGTQSRHLAPQTLSGWQRNGFYTITTANQSQFTIVTAGVDFGSALLGDAEYFLDHATEHQASSWKALNDTNWNSSAWLIVTFYYWAFFLTLAITRLMGNTPWFIDRITKNDLVKLSPSGSRHPGAGSFRIICGPLLSITDRELILKRSGARIHDELWAIWFEWCSAVTLKYQAGTGSQLEQRLFAALALSAKTLGKDWPSALRNSVNYRPGLAYDAVRRSPILGSFSHLRPPVPYAIDHLIDRFETTVVGLTSNTIQSQLEFAGKALIDLTFLLHKIAIDLHRELIDRNRLDKRWANNRRVFLEAKVTSSTQREIWPC